MTKPIIFDGIEHREMTDAEYAQFQLDNAAAIAAAEAAAVKAAAREALLERLGMTAEEAQLLLGGM
jgi:hypothetical protein